MPDKSKVSIILPVYNGERYLAGAIESALAQTYENFELVISDNCSTDSSFEIAQKYQRQDSRIVLSRTENNIGVTRNYNKVISESTGEFIQLFGHDDLFEPTCVEKYAAVLGQYPNVVVATGTRNLIDAEGNLTQVFRPITGSRLIPGRETIRSYVETLDNWISSPVMFRAKYKARGFNLELYAAQDIFYWCQMLAEGDLFYLDEALFSYRIHNDSSTVECLQDLRFAVDLVRVVDKLRFCLDDAPDKAGQDLSQRLIKVADALINYRDHKFDHLQVPAPIDPWREDLTEIERMHADLHDYRRTLCHFFTGSAELVKSHQNEKRDWESEKRELMERLSRLEEQNRQLAQEVQSLKSSTSWKITVPVRRTMELLRPRSK